MRGRIVTMLAWLFIVACAVIVAARVHSHYSAPDYQAPAVWTPPPLVPSPTAAATASASSTTAAAPVSTSLGPGSPLPTGTVTTWVTVTGSP